MTYLVVGGANTVAQGADYVTRDVDLLPRVDAANLRSLGAAMTDLGARLRIGGVTDEESKTLPVQLADGSVFARTEISTWRTDAGDVDVMLTMTDGEGVRRPYEHYAERAVSAMAEGVPVFLAHLADVIASKEHADREKDRVALPALRILLAQQRATANVARQDEVADGS